MTHPYIDCARRLAKKVQIEDIAEVVCEKCRGHAAPPLGTAQAKQSPPNAYAAKFSQPYCIAAGFVLGNAGLDAFTEEARRRPAPARARRQGATRWTDNPYPSSTGHVRVKLKNGSVVEGLVSAPRRARAAVARGRRTSSRATAPTAAGATRRRTLSRLGARRFRRPHRRPRLRGNKPISSSSTASGASAIKVCPEAPISTVFGAGECVPATPSLRAAASSSRRPRMKSAGIDLCRGSFGARVVVAGLEAGV